MLTKFCTVLPTKKHILKIQNYSPKQAIEGKKQKHGLKN